MSALHDDPRVIAGMRAQFAQRQRLLDAGARPLGWKLGLGTPAAMEKAGTTAPLVGFLTDRGLLEPGADVGDRRLDEARRRAGGGGSPRP